MDAVDGDRIVDAILAIVLGLDDVAAKQGTICRVYRLCATKQYL